MSLIHDTLWQTAVDEIAHALAADLPFVRSLKHDWIYMREHSSEELSLCYGYVRYPRTETTDRESFVVFADRQDEEGPRQQRYFAGFQFAEGNSVYPIQAETLADLRD